MHIHSICTGDGVDFVSDSTNATFAPQEQQSVVMIPIMEDELTEDIEYFGIRFRQTPSLWCSDQVKSP